ncbi:MAG: FimB/Mfa2 family fimbrial subunit [Bacteroidales bacterium]|nr:FimB/Mfa2 family fimbrial subunit [Bacteroidales bacterium]
MLTSRSFLNLCAAGALSLSALSLVSCDGSGIYEDLSPCETAHKITFNFDYNMSFAEGFKNNVHSVAIYGFDKQTGLLEFVLTERGDKLAQDGFALDLDGVAPGDYDIVSWCGMDNSLTGTHEENFRLSDPVVGETTRDELICRLERDIQQDGSHHFEGEMYDLFYGKVAEVKIHEPNETPGEVHTYNVPLKKNTNGVWLILQQLSGDNMEAGEFTYTITDNNGTMNADNEVDGTAPKITFHPFEVREAEAELGADEYPNISTKGFTMPVNRPQFIEPGQKKTRAQITNRCAVAHFTIPRLMTDHRSILTIYNDKQEMVCQVPLQPYALLTKYKVQDDQEFLDRQDDYRFTFFLDENKKWVSSSIIVNSWKIKVNQGGFGN